MTTAPPGEAIQLWRIALDEVDLSPAAEYLDPDERRRAEGFATPVLRCRFMARRLALRQILGNAIDVVPARVTMEFGVHGKPRLRDRPGLFFNVSHSGGVALLALSTRGEVGVDVEAIRDVPRWTEVVRAFFADAECKALLSPGGTAAAFLAYWTRKEAVAKAVGLGLALPMNSFSVAGCTGRVESVISLRDADVMPRAWHVRDLVFDPRHVAALASSAAVAEIIWKAFPEA